MQPDVLGVGLEHGRQCPHRERLELAARVDVEDAVLEARHAVHRLHLHVGDVVRHVRGLVPLRGRAHGGLDVSHLVPALQRGVVLGLAELGEDRLRRDRGVRARVPGDLERVARLHRGLVARRHHGDEVGQRDGRHVALHALGRAVVNGGARGALARRRIGDLGVDHVGQERVDAELGLAGDLLGDVQARRPLADHAVVGRLLERDLLEVVLAEGLRDGHALDDLAVAERAAGGEMAHDAALGHALGGRDVPRRGGRVHQRQAGGGAGARERVEGPVHRPAAAGEHQAVLLVGRRIVDADVLPVRLQLLGDDLGQRRAHALPHLGLGDVHGHETVGGDGEHRAGIEGGRSRGVGGAEERKAEGEADGGGGAGGEERAPRESCRHG